MDALSSIVYNLSNNILKNININIMLSNAIKMKRNFVKELKQDKQNNVICIFYIPHNIKAIQTKTKRIIFLFL